MAAVQKTTTTSVPPNQSLYLQNLPEKIQKYDLSRELYMLFSTYGPVLDVTTLKAKMRGQAHVLFRDTQSATQAMRSCQGMEFFGKEMKISYSKNRSKTLSRLTGVANPAPQIGQTPASSALRQALPPPAGLPPRLPPATQASNLLPPGAPPKAANAPSPGTKRPREESDDEKSGSEGAAMEEDDDDEGEMDMSDDDD